MAIGGSGCRWQGHVGPGRVLLLLQVEALDGGDEVPQGAVTCSGVKTADGGGTEGTGDGGVGGVAVETGAASAVVPEADVVGVVRGGAIIIGMVRDGAVVIGAVEPLESAGGGGGSDMIGTWSLITKLVGLAKTWWLQLGYSNSWA